MLCAGGWLTKCCWSTVLISEYICAEPMPGGLSAAAVQRRVSLAAAQPGKAAKQLNKALLATGLASPLEAAQEAGLVHTRTSPSEVPFPEAVVNRLSDPVWTLPDPQVTLAQHNAS